MVTSDVEMPTRIARFEVTGIVGRGGMGTVFRAFDPELQRPVAIKVLHGAGAVTVQEGGTINLRAPGSGSEELLIEARALAQIAHPNVLAVHELARDHGQTFLVMELVEGVSMREWLAAKPRTVDEIRGCFRQAAEGLAAAHAHHVVHRDFKPDNVLISEDGRVRVADFGLATLAPTASSMVRVGIAGGGTPSYMAPELWRDQPATTSSDIYAFSVSLIEALAGELPDPRTPVAEIQRRLSARRVERRVRDIAVRGIAEQAVQRPGSIREVAAVLEGSPRRRVAVWIGFGAAASAIGGAALAAAIGTVPAAAACADARAMLAGRWDDAQRATVRGALAKTYQMTPDEIARDVVGPLDAYASSFVKLRDEACRADLPADRRTARLSCLDRRLYELSSVATAIANAPSRERISARVTFLPQLAPCAEQTKVRMPPSAAQQSAVESITQRFLQVQDRYYAQRSRPGDPAELEQLEREAEDAADIELKVRILRAHGSLLRDASRHAEAEKIALDAYQTALKHGLDTAALEAVIDVAKIQLASQQIGAADSYTRTALSLLAKPENQTPRVRMRVYQSMVQLESTRGDIPAARRYLAEARAALQQTDVPDAKDTLAQLFLDESRIDDLDGKYELGLEHAKRAEQLYRQISPANTGIGDALGSISQLNARLERYADARRAKQAQVDLLTQLLPPTHHKLLGAREGLAIAAIRDGDFAGGIKLYEESLERAKLNPLVRVNRSITLHNMAGAYWDLGNRARARELEQLAVDEAVATLDPKHPDVAYRLTQLAQFDMLLGKYAMAEAELDRADPLLAVMRADHPRRLRLATFRIELLRRQKKLAAAQRLAGDMMRLLEERKVPDRDREEVWRAVGAVQVARKDLRGARETFERLRASTVARTAPADEVAKADLALGPVEYALGDRAAAIERLRRAKPVLDKTADERGELRAWARANRVKL